MDVHKVYSMCIIVFMSPENATSKQWCTMFEDKYVKRHLVLIAVDEVHRISDWSVALLLLALLT